MPTKTPHKNIPSWWKYLKIKDIAPLQRGFDLPVNNIQIGDYPVVFSNGMLKFHNEFKAEWPGVITGRSGTIGKVHFIEQNYWPHNTALWVTDFKKNNPKYIYYFYFQLGLWKFSSGSGVPTLNRNDVHAHKVVFPPLPEQNRIVSVLETWDRAIKTLTKKIEIKKQIKKGLMQELLTGKTRLKGFSGKWNKIALSNIGNFFKWMGILKDEITESGHNAVRYGELYTKYNVKIEKVFSFIPSDVVPSAQKIQYGDILFAGSGETIDEIGKSASYLINEEWYAGGDIIIFRPKKADSLFLWYFFNTGEARKKLRELGQGQAVVHLYKSDIEDLSFQLPTQEEQVAIASILNSADNEITSLEKKLKLLEVQKKYLINSLITGEIRTPENLTLHI